MLANWQSNSWGRRCRRLNEKLAFHPCNSALCASGGDTPSGGSSSTVDTVETVDSEVYALVTSTALLRNFSTI